jgi:hypothetical protein
MKTCLIWGNDGLDLDLTYNLVSFYKDLGFNVFFSWTLHKADLLIVTRAMDRGTDVSSFNFRLVHIYDYTGWDYDSFLLNTDPHKTFIFCTSEEKKARLAEKNNFPGDHIFVAFPPVDTAQWSKKLKKLKYEFVHIGNHKPIIGSDKFKEKFDEAIVHFRPHLWGSGWRIKDKSYRGKAGLFRVSSIYSGSRFAFGLMFPFQRDVTFSGRFWHAPLNGCILLSEPGVYAGKMPGVIETDYSIEDIVRKTSGNFDRKEVQEKAQEYWKKQNSNTMGHVKPTLLMITDDYFILNKFLLYIRFRAFNILIKLYQKCKGLLSNC